MPLKLLALVALHCRSKVVELPAVTGELGALVTVKPVGGVTVPTVRSAVPVLFDSEGVGHRRADLVVPKSVSSVVLGVVSPLVMSMPLPLTAIARYPVDRCRSRRS